MKYILKFFFFGIVSSFGAIVCTYILGLIFIESSDLSIELDIRSNSIDSVNVTYNVLPNQFGAEVFSQSLKNDTVQQFALKADKQVKSIYIQPNTSGNVTLSGIRIKGYIDGIKVPFNAYDSSLSIVTKGTLKRVFLGVQEVNTIQISDNEMLQIEGQLFDEMYAKIDEPIINFSIIFSVLLFLGLFSFSFWSDGAFFNPTKDFFLTTVFLVIILGFFFSRKEVSNIENRQLASKPSLRQNIWRIPSKYVKYYNDHFPARVELSRINNYIKIKYFNTSPNPNSVQIGKEGWLFYSTKKIRAVYQGNLLYTEEELAIIKEKLELKAKYLSEKGIEFYLMIPPLKHSIYPEYLPSLLKPKQEFSKREQVLRYLKEHSNIKIVDAFERLKKLKKERRIYYKTDTHWNQVGGLEGYRVLIDRIREDFDSIPKPHGVEEYELLEKIDYEGDLINLLNLKGYYSRQALFLTPAFKPVSEYIDPGNVLGTEIKIDRYRFASGKELPKILMYRDSFSEYMRKHISNHFSESVFVWDRNFNPERIDQENPDIIVLEMMERFVDHLLTENEK